MTDKIKQALRLIRTIIAVIVIGGAGIYIYAQKDNGYNQTDRVVEIQNFYSTSGYNNEWEYKKDIEELKREKQAILDTLSYKETVQFYNDGTYIDSIGEMKITRLQTIDSIITDATQRIIDLPDPDYTTMNQASKPKTQATGLDFMKLLK